MSKWCGSCETKKGLKEFHKDRTKICGRASVCVPCAREKARRHYKQKGRPGDRDRKRISRQNRKYRRENRSAVKEYSRWYHIRRKYGLSKEQWYAIYDAQDGRCYICQRTEAQIRKSKSKYLTVDHCHTTGVIRGLLCGNCNMNVLPGIRENAQVAERIVSYLTRGVSYGIVPGHQSIFEAV